MEDAANTLRSFFTEMFAWEKQAWKDMPAARRAPEDKWEAANKKLFEPLESIFGRYCTAAHDWRSRKHMGDLPEYDPNTQLVIETEVKGDRATVTTKRTDWFRDGEIAVYELVRICGDWRIDKRKLVQKSGRKKTTEL